MTCCRCFASFSLLAFTLKTATPSAFRKANFRYVRTTTPEMRCNIGLGTSIFGWSAFHYRWGASMMKVEEGEKVEAVFDEGDLRNWYPGVVDQVNPDGTLDIRWDYPDGGPAISRVAEEDVQRYTPPKRIADLDPGSAHRGTVVEITRYGVFVDIGATRDGLVHISCLRKGFVEKIEDEVELGQEVMVSS